MHPKYLGWQIDWPVFVKVPFSANGKTYERLEHFNWVNKIEPEKVATLYNSGFLYHNKDLEKESKVGTRLEEFDKAKLKTLVTLLNAIVKERTPSKTQFDEKKCRSSSIEDKQRAYIRRFLYLNPWINEEFYEIRDKLLGE